MKSLSKVLAIIRKDIIAEMRTREVIVSVLVFAMLVIVIFNFALGADRPTMETVAPGILWVTFAFAGVLSLNRSFITEKEEGCLEGLLACPVSREAIYFGKMFSSFLFMLIVEAITLPVFALLFNIPVLSPEVITITVLATLGFVAVGTLFSALAVNTKAREMILPILFLPIALPVIISAVKATELALAGDSWGGLFSWLQIIVAFDIVFLVVSYLIFNFIIEE